MMQSTYESPIGRLILTEEGGHLTGVERNSSREVEESTSSLLEEVKRQLEEYFGGERREFSLPLKPKGTKFQLEVWEALRTVPFGKLETYKSLAELTESPKAYRAVGSALGKNPLLIITPCHRVNNTSGNVQHFSAGVDAKEWLQKHEASV